MSKTRIAIPPEAIAAFCRRHQIRKLSLFGSVLRDDFRPDSDVDVRVEYEPDHLVGMAITVGGSVSKKKDDRSRNTTNKELHDEEMP